MPPERALTRATEQTAAGAGPPDARIAEIATWLGQFSRTLKTCRLYDARNPNTIKFREDLGTAMVALLEARGAFRLEFSAHQVTCDTHPVMVSRPGEDSFVMPFYRDGLRTLTFNPDAEPRELDVIVDLLLRVTNRASNGSEDLVTLLWDADMPHIDMTYVASETDADMGDEGDDFSLGEPTQASGKIMPWPDSGGGTPGEGKPKDGPGGTGGHGGTGTSAAAPATGESAGVSGSRSAPAEVKPPDSATISIRLRSDDWLAGEPAHELDERYLALDATSITDLDRFTADLQQDRGRSLVPATLGLVRDDLRSDLLEGDRADLADLLERALHDAIGAAGWADAREAVDCLTELTEGQWDATPLIEALAKPDEAVTVSLVRYLDEHTVAEVTEFVEFARTLGPAAIEWLMGIVALASHERTRRTLVRALTELCEGNPEVLAPWLTDERWHVVRNAVFIMGATTGGAPAALFRPLVHHPEPRVRQEVVAALANTDIEAARPLLLALIQDSEASIRGTALHRLGSQRNQQASAALIAIVLDPGFRKRPVDEVRSITTALGGCAGDEALPHLEEQLYAPKWFSTGAGPYCQMIARCIMRIGTPAALAMLEQGARSRIAATRDACRLVLKGTGHV
jgi:HEAT repeat protein